MRTNLNRQLLKSIKNSDCSSVRSLIARGADVNRANDFRRSSSCLHIVMRDNPSWNQNLQVELVKILLDAGADVFATDDWNNTCLHLAAESDRTGQIVDLFLKAGAGKLINRRNRSDRTALQEAVMYGYEDFDESSDRRSVVEKLVEAGADSTEGCAFLHELCAGNVEMLRFFMDVDGIEEKVNEANRDGLTPLQIGVKHNVAVDLIERMIVDMGADVNFLSPKDYDVGTPLHIAAWHGFDDKVEVLLKHGADPQKVNKYLETPMFLASKNLRQSGNYVNIFQSLMRYGADVNDGGPGGYAPFGVVVENGNLDMVKFFLDLVDQGIVDQSEMLLLHTAAANVDYPILRYLLDESVCDVNDTNYNGFTALHSVVKKTFANSHLNVQMLLDAGADVNARSECGSSILDLATREGDPKVMQTLIRHIALLEIKGSYVNQEYFDVIAQNIEAENIFRNCKDELTLTKSIVIEGSTSYYSILTQNTWVRNQIIVKKLEVFDWSSHDFKKRFPIYSDLIRSNFLNVIDRHRLVENAVMGLERILGSILWLDFDVFHTIYYRILHYLSKKDLINLHNLTL